ncbi:hypothetical protein DBT_0436 [Dissulfuribacter thermophilus]|uniref:Peptidase S26 domain-containing protein n=1 Tax=Dissulfuribacter thermophilus TaxID=1156395 RepID=A0A1B9F800_9BACT|nr:S26 family signal peptidase [Dissulfuribacter thermophilus]OCC15974.1 hypothetical protein DBT_0436 [Dissulfuribacter thermophilus]
MVKIIRVHGKSLFPDFHPGDYVLLWTGKRAVRTIKEGDVIVFRQAAYGTLIKRVEKVDPENGLLHVRGTHPASADSKYFGPIPPEEVIGKMIAHIRRPSK